uniref:GYF domain-containing protein n=1 Tax=Chromera velia CCMP2878 TaxID=1169474 RepID=A0A0G4G2B3_9ALVE|eukprot:Cvel_19882.t1-p1 / transcript=Cvel_19882.t1 / gene=Cvel_19882 / organism=Chromera_velia_CCMP2878 / gene_product=hypothetical protein / transcript_product=hypothetical protein / location=Cvel_scaffold1744:27877-32743(+) / protein_length=387 / sequence_SO=supercontig / SO=protein_coding / is_pseudo=false
MSGKRETYFHAFGDYEDSGASMDEYKKQMSVMSRPSTAGKRKTVLFLMKDMPQQVEAAEGDGDDGWSDSDDDANDDFDAAQRKATARAHRKSRIEDVLGQIGRAGMRGTNMTTWTEDTGRGSTKPTAPDKYRRPTIQQMQALGRPEVAKAYNYKIPYGGGGSDDEGGSPSKSPGYPQGGGAGKGAYGAQAAHMATAASEPLIPIKSQIWKLSKDKNQWEVARLKLIDGSLLFFKDQSMQPLVKIRFWDNIIRTKPHPEDKRSFLLFWDDLKGTKQEFELRAPSEAWRDAWVQRIYQHYHRSAIMVAQLHEAEIPTRMNRWYYVDPQGETQGPHTLRDMLIWHEQGYFHPHMGVCHESGQWQRILNANMLRDASVKTRAASKAIGWTV